jgi:ABC-type thiamin/hydroxymethylpyrimidine transport system permease subunit
MSLDIAAVKRRRSIMLAVNGLAVLGAAAAAVGYFVYAQSWALLVFVAALLAGFGAQIWFIAGLRKPRKGA